MEPIHLLLCKLSYRTLFFELNRGRSTARERALSLHKSLSKKGLRPSSRRKTTTDSVLIIDDTQKAIIFIKFIMASICSSEERRVRERQHEDEIQSYSSSCSTIKISHISPERYKECLKVRLLDSEHKLTKSHRETQM